MQTRAAIVRDGSETAGNRHNRASGAVRWSSHRTTWLLATVLSAIAAFPLQDALTRFPRGLLADDAYFYVKVAWNLGTQGVSSFDGIHVTDGYHLLWQWMLAAVSFLVGIFSVNLSAHLGAMLWVYFMMCCAIGIIFGRSRVDASLLFGVGVILKIMMETTLLSLILLALYANVYLVASEEPPTSTRRDWRWRPLLLVLVPLVRIDAILIGLVMVFSRVFQRAMPHRRSSQLRKAANDVAWLGVGAVLQLMWRRWYFGEWTSVSMQIKASSTSMALRIQNNLIGLYGSNLISIAVFGFFFALAIWAAIRRGPAERVRDLVALSGPAAFVVFHLAANSQVSYWYFLPAVYVHAWYFLWFGPRPSSRAGWIGRAAIAMLPVMVAAKWAIDSRIRAQQIEWSRQFVEHVQRVVPENEPIFQIDASGWVGWFSRRHVVNGDGLVNDHAYAKRLRENELADYLRDERIHYIIQNQYPRNDTLIDIGGLRVPLESVDVVIAPPANFPDLTAFGLYRVK